MTRDIRNVPGDAAPFPAPKADDADDVADNLSVAATMWARGDRADALNWLRRAAESAADADDDVRALELAKAVAALSQPPPPSPPSTSSAPAPRIAPSAPPAKAPRSARGSTPPAAQHSPPSKLPSSSVGKVPNKSPARAPARSNAPPRLGPLPPLRPLGAKTQSYEPSRGSHAPSRPESSSGGDVLTSAPPMGASDSSTDSARASAEGTTVPARARSMDGTPADAGVGHDHGAMNETMELESFQELQDSPDPWGAPMAEPPSPQPIASRDAAKPHEDDREDVTETIRRDAPSEEDAPTTELPRPTVPQALGEGEGNDAPRGVEPSPRPGEVLARSAAVAQTTIRIGGDADSASLSSAVAVPHGSAGDRATTPAPQLPLAVGVRVRVVSGTGGVRVFADGDPSGVGGVAAVLVPLEPDDDLRALFSRRP